MKFPGKSQHFRELSPGEPAASTVNIYNNNLSQVKIIIMRLLYLIFAGKFQGLTKITFQLSTIQIRGYYLLDTRGLFKAYRIHSGFGLFSHC